MRITGWSFDYLFSANPRRSFEPAYSAYSEIEMSGVPFRPSRLAASQASIQVHTDDTLSKVEDGNTPRRSIGWVEFEDGLLSGHVWIPREDLALLSQWLTAGELRYGVLFGERLRRRMARIRSAEFSSRLDERDDVPDV